MKVVDDRIEALGFALLTALGALPLQHKVRREQAHEGRTNSRAKTHGLAAQKGFAASTRKNLIDALAVGWI